MKNFVSNKRKFLITVLSIVFLFTAFFAVTNIGSSITLGEQALNASAAVDYKILSNNSEFTCFASEIKDKESAKEIVKEEIAKLGVLSEYDIINDAFLAPQLGADGSYVFTVKFVENRKAVKCELKITAYEQPLIIDFSNPAHVNTMRPGNGKVTSENGKLKLSAGSGVSSRNAYLRFNFSSFTDGDFIGQNLPYLKVKYKTSNGNKLNIPIELYYTEGMTESGSDKNCNYKDINVPNGSVEGDEIILIMDMSVMDTTTDAVWVFDQTSGSSSVLKLAGAGYGAGSEHYGFAFKDKIDAFRINFNSWGDCNRTTIVDYMGFFPSFESAKSYTPSVADFSTSAQEMTEREISCLWGDAYDEETAVKQAEIEVGKEFGFSCSVLDYEYTPATEETEGKLIFSAVFKNAGKTEIVDGITMIINKKPSDYKMIDMSNKDLVEKFAHGSYDYSYEEDGSFKMVKSGAVDENYPEDILDDGFFFHVPFGDDADDAMDAFYLQDYSYIVLRYKREGMAGGQLFYWVKEHVGDVPYCELYLGKNEGHWYTSILCTRVKSYDVPLVINYDETLGVVEPTRTIEAYGIHWEEFEGVVEKIRFNFARKRYLDRTAWVDYIAFFPALEDAQEYFAINALGEYSGEKLAFYQGDSENQAKLCAEQAIRARIGQTAYDIEFSSVNYLAPVKNTTDGQIKLTAHFKDAQGTELFSSNELTFVIDKQVDGTKSEFIFASPYFIRDIQGSTPTSDSEYKMMTLSGYNSRFTFSVAENRQFFIKEKQFVSFKVNADTSALVVKVNDGKYTLNYDLSGDKIVTLDLTTGEFYIGGNLVYTDAQAVIATGKINSLGMEFGAYSASVYAIAFFGVKSEAIGYTAELEVDQGLETLAGAILNGNYTSLYKEANSELKAIKRLRKLVANKMTAGYHLYDVETVSYTAATTETLGSITANAYIYAGDVYSSLFKKITVSMEIGKDVGDSVSAQFNTGTNVRLTEEKGHLFSGRDYVVTKGALGSPLTIEWRMKINASDNENGTFYGIFVSVDSKFGVSVKDGELIYVNGGVKFTTTGLNLYDGKERHLAISVGDKVILYVDGAEWASFDKTGELATDAGALMIGRGIKYDLIGQVMASTYIEGATMRISDVAVYTVFKDVNAINADKQTLPQGDVEGLKFAYSLYEQVYLNDVYTGAINKSERGYYADCMGYVDSSANGNYGVFKSDGWYHLENVVTDYTVIQISDTQSYMFGDKNKDGISDAYLLNDMYGWMGENKEKLNIVMVNNLGDIAQEATVTEFQFTKDAVDTGLTANGIAYNMTLGNHDYFDPYTMIGAVMRDGSSKYEEVFTMEEVIAQYEAVDYVRFGGTFEKDSTVNNYIFFDAGEPAVHYLVLTLEYGPRKEVIQWASEILNKYSDRKAIILTHCYYGTDGTRTDYSATSGGGDFIDAYEGVQIWEELISKHENIVMINCGHSQNNAVQAYVDAGDNGNAVVQILSDPSATNTVDLLNKGNAFPSVDGVIELMCFDNEGRMHTYYYSPLTGMFFDTQFEGMFEMNV